MKCISFNINSLRIRLHQIEAIIEKYQPDIIGIQETKVADEQFPVDDIEALGYHVAFHGQKTHYGVAIMSKHPITQVIKGFETDTDDSQKRFIGIKIAPNTGEEITILNGYFPQGDNQDHEKKFPAKRAFYQDLQQHLKQHHSPNDSLIVMGDMNVAPDLEAIGLPEAERLRWLKKGKCSFLEQEQSWLQTLLDWGLIDTFSLARKAEEPHLSWFDYRTRGFERDPKQGLRIDFILATKPLAGHCTQAGIDHDIRAMEKPSDHCPVFAQFEL